MMLILGRSWKIFCYFYYYPKISIVSFICNCREIFCTRLFLLLSKKRKKKSFIFNCRSVLRFRYFGSRPKMSLDISLFWLMKESATDSDKLPRDSRRFSARQARPPPDRYPVIYRVCMRSRLSIGTFRAVSVAVSFRHAASSPRRPPPPSAVGRHTPIVQLPGIAAPLLTKRRGRQQ